MILFTSVKNSLSTQIRIARLKKIRIINVLTALPVLLIKSSVISFFMLFYFFLIMLQLKKFTNMNVFAYVLYWSDHYPTGPNDPMCKKNKDQATVYQK